MAISSHFKPKTFQRLMLFLAFVLPCVLQSGAETISSTAADWGYENAAEVTSVTIGDFTVKFSQGTGSITPKYYTSDKTMRLYGGNTVTVTSSKSAYTPTKFGDYQLANGSYTFDATTKFKTVTITYTSASGTGNGSGESGSTTPVTVERDNVLYYISGNSAYVTGVADAALTSLIIHSSITYNGKSYPVNSVQDSAFSECENIDDVKIEDSDVELSITSSAFLTVNPVSVYLGRNISDAIFRSYMVDEFDDFDGSEFYSNLETLTIGDKVTTIGDYAFYCCNGLREVAIPNSVTTIGDNAFAWCSAITSLTIGNSVKSVGDDAFYNCDHLKSLVIPNTVESIGYEAFYGCGAMTTLTIGSSVTQIKSKAFANCSSLKEITFNDGEGSISLGDNTFTNVDPQKVYLGRDLSSAIFNASYRLATLTIGGSVTSISDIAFYNCVNISELNFKDGSKKLAIGKEAFDEVTPRTVYLGRNIEAAIFKDNNLLTNLTIGSGASSVSEQCFSGCTGLTSLIIPKSVTSIGRMAFAGCTNIDKITLEDGDVALALGDSTLYNVTPATVYLGRDINRYCFAKNKNLKTLTIGNKVTELSNSAFAECVSLTTVDIPNSVKTIGQLCFNQCVNLENVSIGNSVETLAPGAFGECAGLTSIDIPNSVKTISNLCFALCTNLKSVKLPNSVLTIGEYAFASCPSLETINIPSSISVIEQYTFADCAGLESVSIPGSVITIGKAAFANCTSLKKLIIEDHNTEITLSSNTAFYNTAISYLYLGRNISATQFKNNKNIKTLVIGKMVTEIGSNVFNGCTGLTLVECDATTPPTLQSDTFSSYTATLVAATRSYLSANYWKNFASKYAPYEPTTSLTFEVDGLKYEVISINDLTCRLYGIDDSVSGDIVIPETVPYRSRQFTPISVTELLLFNRNNVTSFTLPDYVTSISAGAIFSSTIKKVVVNTSTTSNFIQNSSIDELVISPNVTSFSSDLSSDYVKKLTIEDGDNNLSLGWNVFSNSCPTEVYFGRKNLVRVWSYPPFETVEIGKNVEWIETYAFGNSNKIRKVISYNTTPPTTDNTFSNDTYSEGVLYVPQGAISAYSTAPGWKGFFDIRGLSDTDGVSDIAADNNTVVCTVPGAICVDGNADVRIVSLNGTTVYSGRGETRINLTPGIYIVIINNIPTKVAVK